MDSTTLRGFLSVNCLQELVGQGRRHRTGTLAFMATGILTKAQEHHNRTHDYESVFWLLLWICAGSPAYSRGVLKTGDPNHVVLSIFWQQDRDIARPLKQHFFTPKERQAKR